MNNKQVQALKQGVYLLHWRDGGRSVAAVGVTSGGRRWIAPINWVAPTLDTWWWRKVIRAEFLLGQEVAGGSP